MTENHHLPADYADRLQEVYGGLSDAERFALWATPPVAPTKCECDRFKHSVEPCSLPPQDNSPVVSSPALCTACLFYCWADDD